MAAGTASTRNESIQKSKEKINVGIIGEMPKESNP